MTGVRRVLGSRFPVRSVNPDDSKSKQSGLLITFRISSSEAMLASRNGAGISSQSSGANAARMRAARFETIGKPKALKQKSIGLPGCAMVRAMGIDARFDQDTPWESSKLASIGSGSA